MPDGTSFGTGSETFKVAAACSPAPGKDHDRYLISASFLGVADGATPLSARWPTAVGDYAAAVLADLHSASADELDVHTVFRQAIIASATEFDVVEPTLSCGVAMARLVGDRVEIAAIGDCGVLVRTRSGVVRRVQDDTLTALDDGTRSLTGEDAQRALERNRASMNTPGGYWIVASNPDAADHIVTATLAACDVDVLPLYSDGFYRLVAPYGVVDGPAALVELVAVRGVKSAVGTLRAREASDAPGGDLLARPDDATAVYAGRGVSP